MGYQLRGNGFGRRVAVLSRPKTRQREDPKEFCTRVKRVTGKALEGQTIRELLKKDGLWQSYRRHLRSCRGCLIWLSMHTKTDTESLLPML